MKGIYILLAWVAFVIYQLFFENYILILTSFPFIIAYVIFQTYSKGNVWKKNVPYRGSFIYLTPLMGIRPDVLGNLVPEGYRLSCLLLGYGIIDRTKTLNHGFSYDVLDPIPSPASSSKSIQQICDERALELFNISQNQKMKVRVYWSGSINSTTSTIAMIKAMHNHLENIEIAYTSYAREAYPDFYNTVVKKVPRRKALRNFSQGIHSNRIMVFGEHGDQLFGSRKIFEFQPDELLSPWEKKFTEFLSEKLQSSQNVDKVLNYLEPQFSRCPVPLNNFCDLLWWIEFSLHWQSSSLRLQASQGEESFKKNFFNTFQFFSSNSFQKWSMNNPMKRIRRLDAIYKWSLKNYICEFMENEEYYYLKRKCIPIRELMAANHKGYAQAIDLEHTYFFQNYDKALTQLSPKAKSLFNLREDINSSTIWQNLLSYEGK